MSHRLVDGRPAPAVRLVPLPPWWFWFVRGLLAVPFAFSVWLAWAGPDARFLSAAALLGGAVAASFRWPAALVHALSIFLLIGVLVFVAWLLTEIM